MGLVRVATNLVRVLTQCNTALHMSSTYKDDLVNENSGTKDSGTMVSKLEFVLQTRSIDSAGNSRTEFRRGNFVISTLRSQPEVPLSP
jgi:hypothetical protein